MHNKFLGLHALLVDNASIISKKSVRYLPKQRMLKLYHIILISYSVLSASTGFLLAAIPDGKKAAIKVSNILPAISSSA